MRVFVFTCLLGITVAAPQGGYNYQQQQSSFGGFSNSHSSSAQEGQNVFQQALQSPTFMQALIGNGGGQSFGQSSYSSRPQPPIIPASFGIRPQLAQPQPQPQPQQQQQFFPQSYNRPAPTITKDIYVHVAPEEPEEHYEQPQAAVAPPRKHYRIVFIKAPTHKFSSRGALRVQQAPSEEKTIIYVLTKKPDPLDLEAAIQEAAPKPPSKPEVYFIKYKTQEEAQHAQRTIQAQYDQLGGTTQVSDEGVAPITSVIGALDQSGGAGQSAGGSSVGLSAPSSSYGTPQVSSGSSSNTINVGTNKYLPPIIRL